MSVDENLTELSELQLDVLREIGNVGAGTPQRHFPVSFSVVLR